MLGSPAPVTRIDPSGFERVASWITTLAPFFLSEDPWGLTSSSRRPALACRASFVDLLRHLLHRPLHCRAFRLGDRVSFSASGVALVLAELLLFPGMIIPEPRA
jgi:hypothetical protein